MQKSKRYSAPRTHKYWTDADLNYSMDLFDAGISISEIARITQRTSDSVRYKMIRMNKKKARLQKNDLSLMDIANLFGFVQNHLRTYVSNKKLIAYKNGRTNYVTRDNLNNWLLNGMADEIINRNYTVTDEGMEMLKPFLQSDKWLVKTAEVLRLFGITSSKLTYWTKHKGFPKPALVLFQRKYKYNKQDIIDWAWHNAKVIITDEQFTGD